MSQSSGDWQRAVDERRKCPGVEPQPDFQHTLLLQRFLMHSRRETRGAFPALEGPTRRSGRGPARRDRPTDKPRPSPPAGRLGWPTRGLREVCFLISPPVPAATGAAGRGTAAAGAPAPGSPPAARGEREEKGPGRSFGRGERSGRGSGSSRGSGPAAAGREGQAGARPGPHREDVNNKQPGEGGRLPAGRGEGGQLRDEAAVAGLWPILLLFLFPPRSAPSVVF